MNNTRKNDNYINGFENRKDITDNTISTIVVQQDGSAVLTIYRQKQILHEKQYRTFSAAKAQETKLLRHYRLSCY